MGLNRPQSALEGCSRATTADCNVALCAGVFQTGILRVSDFRGTLRGAGPRATILRALPDLPVNPASAGFFRDDPFDPDTDPWPYLLQFMEGRATIRDVGIQIPDPPDPSRPTSGWFNSLGGLANGSGPDLRLGPSTQGCVAKVAPGDVVQDQGTGNLVFRR